LPMPVIRVPDEAAALVRMMEVGRAPFRLTEEASIRVELAVTPSGLVLIILWAHHMNFDILSQGCLYRELYLILTGRENELPELLVQYGDYAHWQRQCVSTTVFDVAPLLEELAPHAARVLDLPIDKPRPKKWTFKGDRVTTRLLEEVTFPEGVTPFVAHVTAFLIQLWKSSSQEVVVLGLPYHGRDHACLEPLCGYFINMVPLVAEAGRSTTVAQALAQTKERWRKAVEHADVPFLEVVDGLTKHHGVRFAPGHNPLFQAMLNYRAEAGRLVQDGRFRPQPTHHVEGHMDLDVQVDRDASGIVITHNYCTDLFLPRTVERFAAQYMAALRAISMPAWGPVELWRVPPTANLVADVAVAPALSPELVMERLLPLFARTQQPLPAVAIGAAEQSAKDVALVA